MRAIVLEGSGGPEVLRPATRPDPSPAAGQVRIRIRATALNRADLLQRRGLYPAPKGAPRDIPGLEFAGEVETTGPGVERLTIGNPVMGITAGGTYAERICVPEGLCMPVPVGLGWDEAAAIPEAFLTAHDALRNQGRLQHGETVLVTAAGSGVGTAAVQLAAAAGSRVIAVSRSEAKRRRLEQLGASRVVDPAADDFPGAIRQAAGGPVDVVIDMIGGASTPTHLNVLAHGGRIVVIGLLGGARTDLDLAQLMRRRCTIVGAMLRSRSASEKIALTAEFARHALPLFDDRTLRPVVDRRFPLEEAAAAHAYMETNANFGKIVLIVEGH